MGRGEIFLILCSHGALGGKDDLSLVSLLHKVLEAGRPFDQELKVK